MSDSVTQISTASEEVEAGEVEALEDLVRALKA
jgi:hypothetical protein